MRQKPAIAAIRSMRSAPAGAPVVPVVDRLSANENPLGPSPLAMQAASAAVATMHRYSDPNNTALRAAIAAHVGLNADQVLCANGSDELILLIALCYLEAGDEVVMADGTFISYMMRTGMMGAVQKKIPLRNGAHDLAAMAAAVTPQTRMVLICNPNNPTGSTNGATEMLQLLATVPADVLVVIDEAYIEYATRADFPDMIAELRAGRPNIIVLRTYAKIYGMAGMRLGYALAQPDVLDYLSKARPVFDVNAVAAAAGIAALADTAHLAASRAQTAEARDLYVERLTALGLTPFPSETNFIAVPLPAGVSDAAVVAALAQQGIAISGLAGWGMPGVIRISFGTPAENLRCLAALTAVLAAR
ncbi:MAG: hypothetical protein RLZZ297_2045 [Chloroflexota bacterium]|jgi:histidinol-phosphate aminotransferase